MQFPVATVLSPLIIVAVTYNKLEESACDCLLIMYVCVKMKENFLKSQSWPECIIVKKKKKRATLFSQRNPRPCDTATLRGEREGRSG